MGSAGAGDDASVPGPRDGRGPATAIEPEPVGAAVIFGERIGDARTYVALLAAAGTERGLIGPREVGRLWTRHVLNCAAVAELIPHGAHVVDVGSGAGLPGIPLALARADIRVDLVESLLRRSTFLHQAVDALRLAGRCRVIRARAEDCVGAAGGADVVTARAVAPLARLAAWAAPLLRPGGLLLALKGESAADEVRRDRGAARRVGIIDLDVVSAGAVVAGGPVTVVTGLRSAVGARARAAGGPEPESRLRRTAARRRSAP